MATSRDEFLQRVRQAVSAGNRPGSTTAVGPRGAVGYQGAGPDAVARFRDEFTAAGGHPHLVADRSAAAAKALELAQAQAVKRVLVGGGALLESLNLLEPLRGLGMEVSAVQALQLETGREAFFQADLGISGVDYLVAETGTIVLLARPGEPRSLSLLPPVHIAVAERSQLVPDLFDLFEALGAHEGEATTQPALPSCVTLVTGPSKTGDIELRLVTGVHGPGELHVILITG